MTDKDEFVNMFKAAASLVMGLKLRELVLECLGDVDETIGGGVKVKLALYSKGKPNNVFCGIQPAKNGFCIFYVHYVSDISHERLRFSGKGKHAKSIKFESEADILEKDILWLLSQVKANAPF